MKRAVSFLLLLSIFFVATAQDDVWTAYWNSDTTLYGFKDAKGKVRIEPKFTGYGIAKRFEHIMVTSQEKNSSWELYYLTKSGKMSGKDSIYIFDNTPDCESEGFIRFRNNNINKMGLFNRNGDVVIPAKYNYLDKAVNGLCIALEGAAQKYLDDHKEHYTWEGGTISLIDTLDNPLIVQLTDFEHLNLYSLKRSDVPDKNPVCNNYLGVDGKYYSFINYEKEFSRWLNDLINALTEEKLLAASFNEITCWKEEEWKAIPKATFLLNNFRLLKERLLYIKTPGCDSALFSDGLNPFTYEKDLYRKYFNNCGEAMEWKYPLMKLVISHKDKNGGIKGQDHFDFLRTDEGFRFISATIWNEDFK